MDFQYESNRIFMLDENGILRAEIEFPDTGAEHGNDYAYVCRRNA